MSEALWTAVLIGIFTLLGTLLGMAASSRQAAQASKREVEKEKRNRNWLLRDFSRDRRLAVRDRRCDQAEQFVLNMTEDFHQFRTHAISITALPLGDDPPEELQEYAFWQKRIDRTAYQYGPVVSAISSKRHDLTVPWGKMNQGWKDMSAHYVFAYATRIANQEVVPDQEKLLNAIDEVYGAYNDGQREFIETIDKIRGSRLR